MGFVLNVWRPIKKDTLVIWVDYKPPSHLAFSNRTISLSLTGKGLQARVPSGNTYETEGCFHTDTGIAVR